VIVFPNAKINLGLHVVERRPDGYHNLETLFYPVPLCDILELIPGSEFSFTASGADTGAPPGQNLVEKAWQLMEGLYRLPPVRIHLHKVIPTGAGLGGGSSDAAALLKALNTLYGLGLSPSRLKEIAGSLGADVPFFIANQPAFATGTGNLLKPGGPDLSPYTIAVVKPPDPVPTAQAYRLITLRKPAISLPSLLGQPVETWKNRLTNDFEEVAACLVPETREIKDTLYRLGALYATLSGSGSAVAGIFRSLPAKFREKWPPSYFVYP